MESPNSILVAISDQALLEEVRRVAAAANRAIDAYGFGDGSRDHVLILDAEAAARCGKSAEFAVVVCAGEPGLAEWRAAARMGADHVVGLPDDSAALLRLIANQTYRPSVYGSIIVVSGVRGGAGASVFAAALALSAAASENSTILVDGDPQSAGLDLLLGIEGFPGVRWSGLVVEDGRISAPVLRAALPHSGDRLAVLSGDRRSGAPGSIDAFADIATECATDGDVVVCDLSKRSPSEIARVSSLADLTVLLVPAELRAVSAARPLVSALVSTGRVGAVIRGPAPGGLRVADIAPEIGIPIWASMRPQPRLDLHLERHGLRVGRRSPLAVAAAKVLDIAFGSAEAVAG
ncbi:septum site-determining protein Ssd [Smaragdicoccus niigatensis]|uniref:septum site-determining protein Ssd n=1 Tax=Smaragdicoccus niigatensis TaxID=359359 RepID=UPI0003631086|nr:septum site-determining protein Ssd [Smaragdicoccus niigatensis]